MTLRLRLMLTIGASFALLWTLSSIWTLVDLRTEFRNTLDERLAASAQMVAALMADVPILTSRDASPQPPSYPARNDGVACDIRLVRGDNMGRVIGTTRNSPRQLGEVGPGYRTRTIDGTVWRSFTSDRSGIRITTADRVDRREQLLHDIALATLIPFAIAMAGSMLVLWLGIRRGLLPLEKVRSALAARAPDALMPLNAAALPGEIAPLVLTINTLLERIEHAMERERHFTGNAAHELRTPLTAVKTHIQVAQLAAGRPEGKQSLTQAEEGVRRLQSTLDQLLMLSRLDGSFDFENDMYAEIDTIVRHVLVQIPAPGIARIKLIDAEAGHAIPKVPAALLMTALRNILDNALHHGGIDAQVTVRMEADTATVSVTVEDDGPGMSNDDIGLAAQRFWRKGRGHGSGLGLSIVDAIVTRYDGSWTLNRSAPGGMIVRITLPAAKSLGTAL